MALEDVLNALVTIIEGVPGIGVVLNYFPIATLPEYWGTMLGTSSSINATCLGLSPVQGWTEARQTNTSVTVTYNLTFRCYFETIAAATTEPAFRTLLRAIADELRPSYRQVANDIILQGPVQLVQYGHTLLADNLLCHYAELSFVAQERVFPTYT